MVPQAVKVVKIQGPHVEAEVVPDSDSRTWRDLAEYAKKLRSQDLECQGKIQELSNAVTR